MKRYFLPLWLLTATIAAAQTAPAHGPLKFEKKQVAAESYESVAVIDVNNDKIPDLVSGAFWYEGPAYFKRHYIGPVKQFAEYWDDFSTIPFDVNGDGRMDYITGGWFGKTLVWKENPGKESEWKEHVIATPGNIETTRAWDLDGDGIPEIIPNTPNDPLTIYHHANGAFTAHQLLDRKSGHGLGCGDINGDGRTDLVVPEGWLEAPASPYSAAWIFHPEFNLGTASVPVIVADVNKDGLADLIAGQGHDYGLDWYEQKKDAKTNKRSWIKHVIDPYNSQYHTMEWVDIDGDGDPELMTGKRYRAHNEHDPGSDDPCGIYYFKWNGTSFSKQVISYGSKGAGLYFQVYDLTGSGRKDVIVAGKDGLFIFYNKGNQ
ncbi:FG-GAP repeat domain-containing protein [Chitinophaga arvensicola]|uniref:FG-GAP repeat-containing protein n=1 Tax=Chitinophaga arvensicola TaxID=29529 RepID=A0A1I0S7D4_9BACT|nr:VCBS repeat-containing protein [Chitinophaga arvensicola]SEW51657.1 FG-GAP repeat-containing protein [Chitinophaga arvensicola]